MSRINLILTMQPSEVQIFVGYKNTENIFIHNLAVIDTGAEISFFPLYWLKIAEHKVIKKVELEQAGIAKQVFEAIEAEITIHFEDIQGNISQDLKITAWFAESDKVLIGIRDVLDRAKLYIDFQETHTGWLDV